jgi:hypothetical protein
MHAKFDSDAAQHQQPQNYVERQIEAAEAERHRAGETRNKLVGVAEDEKYGSLTEEPHAAVFLPILQWPNGNGVQARHFRRKGTKCPLVTNRAI